MIEIYTGTPGSGKSYNAVFELVSHLKKGKPAFANFTLRDPDPSWRFTSFANEEVNEVIRWIVKHPLSQEGEGLFIVDEAQLIWNSREWKDIPKSVLGFFSQHRKLGWNIILITQRIEMIDRQIRMLAEFEVKWRKLNNYKIFGFIPLFPLPIPAFLGVRRWINGVVVNREFSILIPRIARYYDSMKFFTEEKLIELFGLEETDDIDLAITPEGELSYREVFRLWSGFPEFEAERRLCLNLVLQRIQQHRKERPGRGGAPPVR